MSTFRISKAEHEKRIELVRETLKKRELDALYLTNAVNIFYLTGYSHIVTERPAALIIPVDGELTFMGPLLEAEHIQLKTRLVKNVMTYLDYPGRKHPIDHFAGFLKDLRLSNTRMGIDNLTGASGIWGYTGPSITEKLPESKFILTKDIIQKMRLIKSEEEIRLIEESAKWANLAHAILQDKVGPGQWDFNISAAASREASMIMKKALGSDYEPLRWSRSPANAGFRGQIGEMSAIPHSIATKRPMKLGDILVTGAGAEVGGYSCELERTMILGKPSLKQRKYFEVMAKAQEEAANALKPGLQCSEVDRVAMKIIKEAGLAKLIRHHTGHGVGLEGHEPPWLDIGYDSVLEIGMIVSCEPGIYDPGFGGFRHSDTLLVTESGAERITYYPRDIESLTIST